MRLIALSAVVATFLFAPAPASAQVPAEAAAPGRAMTAFDPDRHGFRFGNTFKTELIKDIRFGGLCGGMSYAALDYFNRGMRIPQQEERPFTGSTLYSYLMRRQLTSVFDNADKWAELVVNPFGWRTKEFFDWGLQGFGGGRLQELRRELDAGRPVPLGLFRSGNGGAGPHHQVLAIGYDTGRYRGDLKSFKEDLKIFVYDPNFPGKTRTLVPDVEQRHYTYEEDSGKKWTTYFVDRRYRTANPPVIRSGTGQALTAVITTGGDDLRGGGDNVDIRVAFTHRPSLLFRNVNRGARWMNGYTQSLTLDLGRASVGEVESVTLLTDFGGGVDGDNWNVDSLKIRSGATVLFEATGHPLVRFTGERRSFTARLR